MTNTSGVQWFTFDVKESLVSLTCNLRMTIRQGFSDIDRGEELPEARTRRTKGMKGRSIPVELWYILISRSPTLPSWNWYILFFLSSIGAAASSEGSA
jgi:hypothetical protein